MNNELEMLNNEMQEIKTPDNEVVDLFTEFLGIAESQGCPKMAEYYRCKLEELEKADEQENVEVKEDIDFKVEDKLNPENKEDEFGACASFCRKTVTNSETGGAISYHY